MNVGTMVFNLHAMHAPQFLTNSHTSVSRGSGYAEDCMSWGWAVWMWAGGGGCWQVNFTGQHSFCIFGQPAQGSRSTGNSVAARFTYTKEEILYYKKTERIFYLIICNYLFVITACHFDNIMYIIRYLNKEREQTIKSFPMKPIFNLSGKSTTQNYL